MPSQIHAPSRLNRCLQEPLLHFLLIGALLFGVYAWVNRDSPGTEDSHQIVLTEDDLLQMQLTWRAQGRPEPTAEQMQSMIDAKVREEVLYREALAMGLENDDVIVKRRMAQKMEFLAEDLSTLREPTTDELRDWLKSHPQQFAYPPHATFRHLYFSFDDRGQKARGDAAAALAAVTGKAIDSPEVAELGDAFMFQETYADQAPQQVARVFGGNFAQALFEQEPGRWTGPIESGFGWHLIFIESLMPGRVPEFEEVEPEVKAEWLANQRTEFKREAYEVMRAKYEVILPEAGKNGNETEGNTASGER